MSLRYTGPSGSQREYRIGRYGAITVDQARARALDLKAEIFRGGDPAGERDRRRAVPTFEVFANEQFLPHARETIRSYAEYESMLRLRLVPHFGHLRLDEITRGQVTAFRRGLIDEGLSPARVNAHLALLRRTLNLGLRWELFAGQNPAQSPGMLREEPRELFLNDMQLRALMMALAADPDQAAASAIARSSAS